MDFEVEHVVFRHRFADLEEVFLPATFKVINQEAARVPIVLRPVEDFELDVGVLACLDRRGILLPRAVLLLWHMLHICQVLNRAALPRPEHVGQPGAPLLFLFRNFGHLYVVLEADRILLLLPENAALLLAFLLLRMSFHQRLLNFLIIVLINLWLPVVQLDQVFLSEPPWHRLVHLDFDLGNFVEVVIALTHCDTS